MRPLTNRRPKPLVPVLDRPLIEHIIEGACDVGVTELLVIIGYRGDMLRQVLGGGERFGLRLDYAVQEQQLGTGDAVLLAEEFLRGEPFFLSWGDIIVSRSNYARIGHVWREERPDLVLSLNWVKDPWEGAAVYLDGTRVVRIVEKPPRGSSRTNYNNAGIFILPSQILEAAKEVPLSARGERELPDAIQLMLSRGAFVRGVPIEGCWSDVARPAEVIRLNTTLLESPDYPTHSIVAPSAQCARDVTTCLPYLLGAEVRIGPGVRLGPSAFILAHAQIGAGSLVSHSLILQGARVGEGTELVWTVVEEGAVVPPGTRTLGTSDDPVIIGASEEG